LTVFDKDEVIFRNNDTKLSKRLS